MEIRKEELARQELYKEIKKYVDESGNRIHVDFLGEMNLSGELHIKDEKKSGRYTVEIKIGEEQIRKFEKIDSSKITGRSKSAYEKVKKAIYSNANLSLNVICVGLFGPIHSPDLKDHSYNAYDYLHFRVEEVIKISEEIQEVLNDYRGRDIKINVLAGLLDGNHNFNREVDNGDFEDVDSDGNNLDDSPEDPYPRNKIFFGPPGTGKSYKMEQHAESIQIEKTEKENLVRTTFHPEYSYYDFIGQYKPVVGYEIVQHPIIDSEGTAFSYNDRFKKPLIYYEFVPGPFIKVVVKALCLKGKNKNVLLVVEEINRGNCAAIFGDVFQLLDRITDVRDERYGQSKYQIDVAQEVKDYIVKRMGWDKLEWENNFREGFAIPRNLYIYATMNTSDQSLFPMDSAFKRRWSMEYVNIDYDEEKLQELYLPAPYQDIKWLSFIRVINAQIVQSMSSDDKQLGQWFVNASHIDKMEFCGKVLAYLWFDIFRHQPDEIFDSNIKTYDDIYIRVFQSKEIFKTEIIQQMKNNE